MSIPLTAAQAALGGDADALARLARSILIPRNDNLVERPWGGARMLAYKSLAGLAPHSGFGFGEAFELAADDGDGEARLHPSLIRCKDGSTVALPLLLERYAPELLGEAFVRRYGRRLPLLPKTLDVAELLSVQAHPPGNTEVYVIIAADPGATIRLGFCRDIDPATFQARLTEGRNAQQRLLELCGEGADPGALQRVFAPWLARRDATPGELESAFAGLRPRRTPFADVARLASALHEVYWHALDALNEIPVAAGQVIHNANPARIVAGSDRPASAEVHALGNPEAREILALEIRKPGPTFRAWDNVRFPLRDVDIGAAIDALNLRRTEPHEYLAAMRPLRSGVAVSIDSGEFRVEHLTPAPTRVVDVPAEPPHTLHAIAGRVTLTRADGTPLAELDRGESALVPIGVGAYRVSADAAGAHVVKAGLADAG